MYYLWTEGPGLGRTDFAWQSSRLHLWFILLFLQVGIQSCNRSAIRQQLTWRTENSGVFVAAKRTSVEWSWIYDDVITYIQASFPRFHPALASFPDLPASSFCRRNHISNWRRPGVSYHMIYSTHDITGSRHQDIIYPHFISPATEKLEKEDSETIQLILLSFPW